MGCYDKHLVVTQSKRLSTNNERYAQETAVKQLHCFVSVLAKPPMQTKAQAGSASIANVLTRHSNDCYDNRKAQAEAEAESCLNSGSMMYHYKSLPE